MKVHVKKMSQDLNLEDGTVSNFVLLELPNGSIVRAQIDENGAQAITSCHVLGEDAQVIKQETVTAHQVREQPEEQSAPYYPPPTITFGDDVAPQKRARAVAADAYGYPIVRGGVGIDPGEISNGLDLDEDGVGQA